MQTERLGFLALLIFLGCGTDPESSAEYASLRSALVGTYSFAGATNVAVDDARAYIATGSGLGVLDLTTGSQTTYSLATDDVAVSGNLVYALDAVAPGRPVGVLNRGGNGTLRILSFATPASPSFAAPAIDIPVGPYSGVTAAGSRFIVSGGTGLLTAGTLTGGKLATNFNRDLGAGQPDVLLSPDGSQAYVSTDFDRDTVGITVLSMATGATLDSIPLASGTLHVFTTPGQFAPANFALESAVVPGKNLLLTAHVDGLAAIDLLRLDNNMNTSPIVRSLSASALGITPISVEVYGNTAYVVGSSPAPQLVTVDIDTFRVLTRRSLSGTPTSVAVNATSVVVANRSGVQVLLR